MNTLRILSYKGDETLVFDPTDMKATDAARARFTALVGRGYIAYKAPATETGLRGAEVIRDFDPEAREIVLTPALAGG